MCGGELMAGDNFLELGLSFSHVGSRDWTQAVRFAWQTPLPSKPTIPLGVRKYFHI